jgi:glutathione synthase/RimK-type ligase-like ATP-grasp enzyme
MLDGQNMWVIKPADYNRGRGVVIANRLDEVKRIINESFADTKPNDEVKSDLFVIQKYIEKPLLIDGRKFDMRVWVLVTHELECFVFAEGYVRLSSYPFSLAPE